MQSLGEGGKEKAIKKNLERVIMLATRVPGVRFQNCSEVAIVNVYYPSVRNNGYFPVILAARCSALLTLWTI